MGLKKCEKCGEMVDEAKAFCPGCGNAFIVEEVRQRSSEFDKYAGTVQISSSMYNMMLTEMDLDTSRAPEAKVQSDPNKEQRAEIPHEITPPNRGRLVVFALVGAFVLIPLAAAVAYVFLS